ncbi:MAG: flagellar motor protein MotB [Oscillospiraceae bacterium]|jgi:chemotaxis protein MotB|nr:flagellar motor protein MotB [Oscillospiraceae bacterium]MCI1990905.1 flagellar motor protein MotB [Oscillospiraceae bacterium]MCI2034412.1 flagellar motor protein MotB [Oscillospiraceae bacterium]
MKLRKKPEDVPTNGSRWFLTYSDMITLLLALFIMLYSMSSINEKKYEAIAKSIRYAFNGGTGTGTGTGGGTGSGLPIVVGNASSAASGSTSSGKSPAVAGHSSDALSEIFDALSDYIQQNHLENEIGLENTGTYVQIHLKDVVLFNPNSAKMLSSSEPIMKEIEAALAKVYGRVDHITISGHTADVVVDPVHSDELSWQLSTDRAVTVLNELIRYGLSENKLSIQGYAHYDPIATNSTTEGQAKNRRVEITVFKNPTTGVGSTGRDKATMDSQASSSVSPAPSSSGASSEETSSRAPSSQTSSSAPKG